MKIKIGWTFLAVGLLMACSKDNNEVNTEVASITGKTWELSQSTKNGQTSTYPLTIKGDFDEDGTEETLSRSDFYVFEDGWAFRAYSYTVVKDEGTDVITLKSRVGYLFAAAASPYTQNEEKLSVFLKDYTIKQSGDALQLLSDTHQLVFKQTRTIEKDKVKNAPLEPENNVALASKTWRMKSEKGFDVKPDIFYPTERIGDFDGDGTEERLSRDDYYVFSIPWCYTAYISNVIDDQGSDTQTLALQNGVLQVKHLNHFTFNAARDTMYFNGHAYAYVNDGETIILRQGNYEATFEREPNIGANEVIAFYEEED